MTSYIFSSQRPEAFKNARMASELNDSFYFYEIVEADQTEATNDARTLFRELFAGYGIDMTFQNVEEELSKLPNKFCPSKRGALCVVYAPLSPSSSSSSSSSSTPSPPTSSTSSEPSAETRVEAEAEAEAESKEQTHKPKADREFERKSMQPMACVCLRDLGDDIAEIKRLFVKPEFR